MKIKKNVLIAILLTIFLIIINIFVYNDSFLYNKQIIKIQKVKTVSTNYESNTLNLKEKHTTNLYTGIVLNGKEKGNIKKIYYEASKSNVVTEDYKVGDMVFIKGSHIEGLKRDYYVSLLVSVFVLSLYLVGSFIGILAFVSVFLNTFIFIIVLDLFFKGVNLLLLCILSSIVFTFVSLYLSGGKNKKTLAASLSTIISLILLFILSVIIIKITNYKGVNFNEISFITIPYEKVILSELLIGGLGAIMDVAITMSSSVSELINKDKKISIKSLNKSCREISLDITSTMISVLFFTYLCSGLPMFILAIRNGYSVHNYITSNFSLELTRFLVGAIGILIAIIVSKKISIKVLKEGDK